MFEKLIQEAQEALASDDQSRIIECIRKIMLSVPDEITEQALDKFLNR